MNLRLLALIAASSLAIVLNSCSGDTAYTDDLAQQDSQWLIVDLDTSARSYTASVPAEAAPGGSAADHRLVLRRVQVHSTTVGLPADTALVENDEMPQRTATLAGYFIGISELTQGQWQTLGGGQPWTDDGSPSAAALPATGMSYQQALTLLDAATQRLGVRLTLPSGDEWEDAARAGASGLSAFDPTDASARDARAWVAENQPAGSTAHAVAQRDANALGLYDVQGNVWEMTLGRSDDALCTVRGGSYADPARAARFTNRDTLPISIGHPLVGLRLAAHP